MLRIRHIIVLLFMLLAIDSFSQELVKKYFTVSEGLPSNRIYKCLQDRKGFLWLATENGLVRFDGQNFKNYSVNDGLPDSDILEIFVDSVDRLWVIPFNRHPAFLSLNENKLYNSSHIPDFTKIKAKGAVLGKPLKNGDVAFYEYESRLHMVHGERVETVSEKSIEDVIYVTQLNGLDIVISRTSMRVLKSGSSINARSIDFSKVLFTKALEKDGTLYFLRKDSVVQVVKGLDERLNPQLSEIKLPSAAWNIVVLNDGIGAIGIDGMLYLISTRQNVITGEIALNESCKYITQDKSGTYWLCTDDKGLVKLFNPIVTSYNPVGNSKSIAAINVDDHGVLTISSAGEVTEVRQGKTIKTTITGAPDRFTPILPKRILNIPGGHCIVTYWGVFLGCEGKFKAYAKGVGVKDAWSLGDSAILLGSFKSMHTFDLRKRKVVDTLLWQKRTTCVAANSKGEIFFGSNDGLYQIINKKPYFFGDKIPLLSNNITSITVTPDDILWIGTAIDTIVAFKDGKVLLRLPTSLYFLGSVCRTIAYGSTNTIWVGTERSLGKINYKYDGKIVSVNTEYFSSADGLGEGQVNNIDVYNDTVFVATNSGYSKVGLHAKPVEQEIAVYITKVLVNSTDYGLKSNYDLAATQNNLQINFAAVDLSEYKPRFEYRIGNSNWLPISGNTIFLSGLPDGTHKITIRAIRRDNNPSQNTASITIHVKTPLLKSFLFWAITAIFLIGILLLINFRTKLAKQKAFYNQKLALEQQRQKITADLHDDIGASLSSLQLNSNIAARLIDSDRERARTVLNKIEKQSRTLAERIGDIIWSLKSDKEQLMTLSSRIKNFANEILGDTDIVYHISIDESLNEEIKDFTNRKNLVLVAKEAINNAAKYSQASEINISLQKVKDMLVLKIVDNGNGFDEAYIKGNGLENMRKRVQELNGNFSIISDKNIGTTVLASIPFIP